MARKRRRPTGPPRDDASESGSRGTGRRRSRSKSASEGLSPVALGSIVGGSVAAVGLIVVAVLASRDPLASARNPDPDADSKSVASDTPSTPNSPQPPPKPDEPTVRSTDFFFGGPTVTGRLEGATLDGQLGLRFKDGHPRADDRYVFDVQFHFNGTTFGRLYLEPTTEDLLATMDRNRFVRLPFQQAFDPVPPGLGVSFDVHSTVTDGTGKSSTFRVGLGRVSPSRVPTTNPPIPTVPTTPPSGGEPAGSDVVASTVLAANHRPYMGRPINVRGMVVRLRTTSLGTSIALRGAEGKVVNLDVRAKPGDPPLDVRFGQTVTAVAKIAVADISGPYLRDFREFEVTQKAPDELPEPEFLMVTVDELLTRAADPAFPDSLGPPGKKFPRRPIAVSGVVDGVVVHADPGMGAPAAVALRGERGQVVVELMHADHAKDYEKGEPGRAVGQWSFQIPGRTTLSSGTPW